MADNAFAPDGRSLIVADDQHMIHIFDVTTGKELRTFGVANVNGLSQMAVSPDGKLLATRGGGDSFICLWNLQKETKKRMFDLPEGTVTESLVFTSDSNTLFAGVKVVSAGHRFAVYSWNVESGNPGRCWTDELTIGFDPGSWPRRSFAGDDEPRDRGHSILGSQHGQRAGLDAKRMPVRLGTVCFRPDGKTILTVGDDDLAIREWDASSGAPHEPPIAKARGRATRFSIDGKTLIGKSDKTIWLQDSDNRKGSD